DRSLGERGTRGPGHAADGPEERDERGQVVRSHVEERAAARLVVEGRVRVPVFVAVAEHGGRRGDRFADRAVVDQLAAGVQTGAEERIGRTADAYPFRPCPLEEAAAIL